MSQKITAVVLAAGKGTRMKSDKAKVLHEVFFKPMLHHVLDTIKGTQATQCGIIIGHQREAVLQSLAGYTFTPVIQEDQLGTGHAVLCARQVCEDADHVLVLCGDTPLIHSETLEEMIRGHLAHDAAITLMTTSLENPFGYGRILKDENDMITGIVEQKDATLAQRAIKDINAGIYLVAKDFLFKALEQVGTDNSQGEMYLTDIIAIAVKTGLNVRNYFHSQAIDVLGVNSRIELAEAQHELQMRHNRQLMLEGNTMTSPQTTLIAPDCRLMGDVLIHQGVHLTGKTYVGRGCTIEPGAILHDCHVEDGAVIGAHAVLENCSIGKRERIPPLVHRVA